MTGYFYNNANYYQTRIYLKDLNDSIKLFFKFKDTVPKILITDSEDFGVLKSQYGNILYSVLDNKTLVKATLSISTFSLPYFDNESDLYEYLNDKVLIYNNLVSLFIDSILDKSKEKQLLANKVFKFETELLAVASRFNINLSDFGYENSDIIIERRKYVI